MQDSQRPSQVVEKDPEIRLQDLACSRLRLAVVVQSIA